MKRITFILSRKVCIQPDKVRVMGMMVVGSVDDGSGECGCHTSVYLYSTCTALCTHLYIMCIYIIHQRVSIKERKG